MSLVVLNNIAYNTSKIQLLGGVRFSPIEGRTEILDVDPNLILNAPVHSYNTSITLDTIKGSLTIDKDDIIRVYPKGDRCVLEYFDEKIETAIIKSTFEEIIFLVNTVDPPLPGDLGMNDIGFSGDTRIVWDDLRFPFTGQRIDISSGRIDYDYVECSVDFATNARYANEPVCFICQMPHAKKFGTSLHPHIHWIQEEANVPNWLIRYRFYNNGETVPIYTNAAYTRHLFTYSAGDLLQKTIFPEIAAPAGESVSAMADIILYRDSANASGLFAGGDPYTVAAKAKEFDLHLIFDVPGSINKYSKT